MSTLDLSDVVRSLSTASYQIIRLLPGSYGTDGRFQEGGNSTFNILASVQPLRGRELERLDDGLRSLELLNIYSPTQLKVAGAGQDPDIIVINGLNFQVQTSEAWGPSGNYFKMIASKIGRGAD